jgi:hypothetical protein
VNYPPPRRPFLDAPVMTSTFRDEIEVYDHLACVVVDCLLLTNHEYRLVRQFLTLEGAHCPLPSSTRLADLLP